MEIVIIKSTRRELEVRIVAKGGKPLDGEIARYPVQKETKFKIRGGCEYECLDAAHYIDLIK